MKRYSSKIPTKTILTIEIFPYLAWLINRMGVSWKFLGNSFVGNKTLLAQAREISRQIQPKKSVGKPLNIIMATMLGGHPHNLSFEILIGWSLKKQGHDVRFLIDDCTLPITEDHQAGKENIFRQISATSYLFAKRYIKYAGFNILKLSELNEYRNGNSESNFDSIVEASLLKHYKVGVITKDLADLDLKQKLFLDASRISEKAAHSLLKMNPDRVIMSHGIYTTWGPMFNYLVKNEVPVLTYGRGKKANTKKLNWNMTSDWWDVSKEWEVVKEIPLNSEKLSKIDAYLESRISHKNDVLVYNFGELESKEKTFERFNLNPNKLTFALFTNVLWDAASAQREIVFENPVVWVIETIEWFITHPEKQLIIKIHPAEVVVGTRQPFIEIIRQNFNILPENIRIIEPHQKVNSWSIYGVTDIGLVHTTTVGMELPLLGTPCAVVSSTHYRNKGFTIDITKKEDYFDLLKSFTKHSNQLTSKQIEYAKRYSYLLFERYQIPFDFFEESESLKTTSLKVDKIEEAFNDPHFNLIVDGIINEKNILLNE